MPDAPQPPFAQPNGGWGVAFVRASPRQPGVLSDVRIMEAAAVICVDEDDLRALESALVAHEHRPDLRAVAQISATRWPGAGGIIGAASVLDMADLAAPSTRPA